MVKKYLKTLIITSLVILLPVLAGLMLWNQLPEQLPIHWNAAGEIDGWSGKPFVVFGMSLILLALHWICVLATSADPKKQNHSDKMLQLVFWIIPIINTALSVFIYCAALGKQVRVEVLMPMLMGLIFVVLGNYLPKCKQNYTIGIKIPWTLNSEENWNRTHRLAGWVWTIGGLIIMASGFFAGFWLLMAITLIMVFVPFIYSYILHRKGV